MTTLDTLMFVFLMMIAFGGVWFFIKANEE